MSIICSSLQTENFFVWETVFLREFFSKRMYMKNCSPHIWMWCSICARESSVSERVLNGEGYKWLFYLCKDAVCAHIGSIPLIEFFILFFISLGVLHEIAVMDSFDEPKIWEKASHMRTTKGHEEFSFESNPFNFKTLKDHIIVLFVGRVNKMESFFTFQVCNCLGLYLRNSAYVKYWLTLLHILKNITLWMLDLKLFLSWNWKNVTCQIVNWPTLICLVLCLWAWVDFLPQLSQRRNRTCSTTPIDILEHLHLNTACQAKSSWNHLIAQIQYTEPIKQISWTRKVQLVSNFSTNFFASLLPT